MTDLSTIPARDGSTYVHERDARRLAGQHCRVLAYLKDGQWHTLAEIAEHTGDPEASVSARLRDLRKPKFGGYIVEREYVARGLFRYRLRVGQLELVE
jgi:DNA-binding IclR family transcriptional regulator